MLASQRLKQIENRVVTANQQLRHAAREHVNASFSPETGRILAESVTEMDAACTEANEFMKEHGTDLEVEFMLAAIVSQWAPGEQAFHGRG